MARPIPPAFRQRIKEARKAKRGNPFKSKGKAKGGGRGAGKFNFKKGKKGGCGCGCDGSK